MCLHFPLDYNRSKALDCDRVAQVINQRLVKFVDLLPSSAAKAAQLRQAHPYISLPSVSLCPRQKQTEDEFPV